MNELTLDIFSGLTLLAIIAVIMVGIAAIYAIKYFKRQLTDIQVISDDRNNLMVACLGNIEFIGAELSDKGVKYYFMVSGHKKWITKESFELLSKYIKIERSINEDMSRFDEFASREG